MEGRWEGDSLHLRTEQGEVAGNSDYTAAHPIPLSMGRFLPLGSDESH